MSVGHTVGVIWSSNLGFGHNLSDDAIWTTRLLIICTISSQGAKKNTLTSFSYDSLIGGCISVKCQLLTVNFVGFGCQPGFRLHTSRQSFEPSYTRIQALLVFFLSFALASQPFPFWLTHTKQNHKKLTVKWGGGNPHGQSDCFLRPPFRNGC